MFAKKDRQFDADCEATILGQQWGPPARLPAPYKYPFGGTRQKHSGIVAAAAAFLRA
jgi:hypothetical protein